jgi:hypothetical protein
LDETEYTNYSFVIRGNNAEPEIGTCSGNYYSGIGLVYSEPRPTTAACPHEYCNRVKPAEVDSWFYKLPDTGDVQNYLGSVAKDMILGGEKILLPIGNHYDDSASLTSVFFEGALQ